jgi:hypothetical protein
MCPNEIEETPFRVVVGGEHKFEVCEECGRLLGVITGRLEEGDDDRKEEEEG